MANAATSRPGGVPRPSRPPGGKILAGMDSVAGTDSVARFLARTVLVCGRARRGALGRRRGRRDRGGRGALEARPRVFVYPRRGRIVRLGVSEGLRHACPPRKARDAIPAGNVGAAFGEEHASSVLGRVGLRDGCQDAPRSSSARRRLLGHRRSADEKEQC